MNENKLEQALQEQRAGRLSLAEELLRQILQDQPDHPDALYRLGNIQFLNHQLDEAIASYRHAARAKQFPEVFYNLGVVLYENHQAGEAIEAFNKALGLRPQYPEALNNLGRLHYQNHNLDEAITCYRKAVALMPRFAPLYPSLATTLFVSGRLDAALENYQRAVALDPASAALHSHYLHALHFHPAHDAATIHTEHLLWNRHHAEPLRASNLPLDNIPDPTRPLRIGYVSPDFREHPVGRFILPLLTHHDKNAFHVVCYSDVTQPDWLTAKIRAQAGAWRDVHLLSDENLALLVRADEIDILIDLTLHMANNRMLVFARKPAPVQITYLAYPGTSGMNAIDYRLTDPHLDPPDQKDTHYSEQSLRLPKTYWCYNPGVDCEPTTQLPAKRNGFVTFGCFNNFAKISGPAWEAWRAILQAIPNSRILLHAHPGSHRHEAAPRLAVDPGRIEFADFAPLPQYLAMHDRVDIALDPFPYNGGTTTCDALWMGVPVVTLAGKTAVGRAGVSILRNVGLPDLIARDVNQYIQIAQDLACDFTRLTTLRTTLRNKMEQSPLMDAPAFARDIESTYRAAWQRWTERGSQ